MTRIAVVVVLGAVVPSLAKTPPAMQCLKRVRADRKVCLEEAKTRCEAAFRAALGPCFPEGSTCAPGCLDAQKRCEAGPRGRQADCERACNDELKVALQGCRGEAGGDACATRARLATFKCRQKCARASVAAMSRCGDTANDCIRACAASP